MGGRPGWGEPRRDGGQARNVGEGGRIQGDTGERRTGSPLHAVRTSPADLSPPLPAPLHLQASHPTCPPTPTGLSPYLPPLHLQAYHPLYLPPRTCALH